MQSIDIGYFNLTLDIEEAFDMKQGDVRQQVEGLSITHFKTTAGRPPLSQRLGNKPAALGAPHRPLAIESGKTSLSANRLSRSESTASAPPPYSVTNGSSSTAAAGSMSHGALALGKPKPAPPTKPKPSRLSGVPQTETVTALYDYEAQAPGDLSFSAGETIEIVQRTQNENEWWTGKVGGREGQFPGEFNAINYRQVSCDQNG